MAFEAERSLVSQAPQTRLLPRRMQASAGSSLAWFQNRESDKYR